MIQLLICKLRKELYLEFLFKNNFKTSGTKNIIFVSNYAIDKVTFYIKRGNTRRKSSQEQQLLKSDGKFLFTFYLMIYITKINR